MAQEIEPIAHFIIFGETFSGKTYYTKYLLEEKIKPKKIFVFTASPHEWNRFRPDITTIYEDNFDENANRIMIDHKAIIDEERSQCIAVGKEYVSHTPYVVLFDDFNEQINTKTNDIYKQLFTRGRHSGIRVINLAHTAKAIGPSARANAIMYVIMAATSDAEIEALAEMCFENNHTALKRACRAQYELNPFNVIIINKRKKTLNIDCAPAPVVNEHDINVVVDVPPNAGVMQNPGQTMYTGIAAPNIITNVGNKQAHNLYDNSQNNFNVNHEIKMTQMIESNNIHNQIKMENIIADHKARRLEDKLLVRDLCYSTYRTPEQKKLMVETFNRLLRPNPAFNMSDYEEGIPPFLKKYFNEKFNPNSKQTAPNMLGRAADIYLAGSDPVSLVQAGMSFIQSSKLMSTTGDYSAPRAALPQIDRRDVRDKAPLRIKNNR